MSDSHHCECSSKGAICFKKLTFYHNMLTLPTTACSILQTLMGNIISGYPRALITANDHKRDVRSKRLSFVTTGLTLPTAASGTQLARMARNLSLRHPLKASYVTCLEESNHVQSQCAMHACRSLALCGPSFSSWSTASYVHHASGACTGKRRARNARSPTKCARENAKR